MAYFYLCLALPTSKMVWDFFNTSLWDKRESMAVPPGRAQQRLPGLLTATGAAGLSGPLRGPATRTGSAPLPFVS